MARVHARTTAARVADDVARRKDANEDHPRKAGSAEGEAAHASNAVAATIFLSGPLPAGIGRSHPWKWCSLFFDGGAARFLKIFRNRFLGMRRMDESAFAPKDPR
jgi:hypothetical protein